MGRTGRDYVALTGKLPYLPISHKMKVIYLNNIFCSSIYRISKKGLILLVNQQNGSTWLLIR